MRRTTRRARSRWTRADVIWFAGILAAQILGSLLIVSGIVTLIGLCESRQP